MRRTILTIIASILCLAAALQAQQPQATFTLTPVAGQIYLLQGDGGNIGVLADPGGVLMIDSMYQRSARIHPRGDQVAARRRQSAISDQHPLAQRSHGGQHRFRPGSHYCRTRECPRSPRKASSPVRPAIQCLSRRRLAFRNLFRHSDALRRGMNRSGWCTIRMPIPTETRSCSSTNQKSCTWEICFSRACSRSWMWTTAETSKTGFGNSTRS